MMGHKVSQVDPFRALDIKRQLQDMGVVLVASRDKVFQVNTPARHAPHAQKVIEANINECFMLADFEIPAVKNPSEAVRRWAEYYPDKSAFQARMNEWAMMLEAIGK